MPRSDSVLLTGMTSGSMSKAERAKEKEKERKQVKESTRTKIAPTIEPVIEELIKERDRVVLEILESIDTRTGDEDFKATVLALNLYKESMNSLKSRLSTIMRVK